MLFVKFLKKNWPFFLGILLSLCIVWLLFTLPIFSYQVNNNLIRLYEVHKCIIDHQFPCRWVPDLGNTHGSPIFNYLPSIPYYFGNLIFLFSKSYSFSIKLLFGLSFLAIYSFTYFFIRMFFIRIKAFLITSIYFLTSIYILASFSNNFLGEVWGLIFIPLILLELNKLSQKLTLKNFQTLILLLTLFFLSSQFYIFLTLFILTWIFIKYLKEKSKALLIYSLASILYAFFLSSFYILPKILERNLIGKDYFPATMKGKSEEGIGVRYKILTGNSKISNFSEGTNWFKFEAETKDHTIVRLSQYYFPKWQVFVDGNLARLEYENNEQGLMTIFLGVGHHIIEGRLFNTQIRVVSNVISAVFLTIFLITLISQIKSVKKWIKYYRIRIN